MIDTKSCIVPGTSHVIDVDMTTYLYSISLTKMSPLSGWSTRMIQQRKHSHSTSHEMITRLIVLALVVVHITIVGGFLLNPSVQIHQGRCNQCPIRTYSSILNLAKKRRKKVSKKNKSQSKLPRFVVFDLDGCLWRPELFELTISQDGGSPFALNKKDKIPGTTLKSANGQCMELLGDTRQILHQLYYEERWYPTMVGISSRTDPSEWAYELLSKFSIYDDNNSSLLPISMKDVFTHPSLCILDPFCDKATQFEILLERANDLILSKNRNIFDNEAGNCKQVARLGVTCVYTPKGVTLQAWENGLNNFPANRVLGPNLPY